MDRSALGDRMKSYESREERRLMRGLPVIARLDGRCFSRFTKGMDRPFDMAMVRAMIDTAAWMAREFNVSLAYTQSDEISLVWNLPQGAEMPFGGKVQKMTSLLAAACSVRFSKLCGQRFNLIPYMNKHPHPTFDCRVFQVPDLVEATNCILWREQDATRNSIQSAARSVYSHVQCYKKNGSELQEMLHEKGVNWNDYPPFFKRGTYIRRYINYRLMTADELEQIPEKHWPDGPVERVDFEACEWPKLSSITNRVAVLFEGKEPDTEESS